MAKHIIHADERWGAMNCRPRRPPASLLVILATKLRLQMGLCLQDIDDRRGLISGRDTVFWYPKNSNSNSNRNRNRNYSKRRRRRRRRRRITITIKIISFKSIAFISIASNQILQKWHRREFTYLRRSYNFQKKNAF